MSKPTRLRSLLAALFNEEARKNGMCIVYLGGWLGWGEE